MRRGVVAALVADVCQSLARSGFGKILVIRGHAEEENLEALRVGAEQAEVGGGLRPVRDSTRPSEVSSRRKPRLCCAPDLFLRAGMKPIAEMARGTLPQADPL